MGTNELNTRAIKYRYWYKGEMFNREDIKEEEFYISELENTDKIRMQDTGLKDKNGISIYEGDLIKYKGNSRKRIVFFDQERLQYRLRCDENGNYSSYSLHNWSRSMEVIGNIFEATHETTSY